MNGGLSQFARVLNSLKTPAPTLQRRLEYVEANAADEQERRDRQELQQFTDDYGLGVGE